MKNNSEDAAVQHEAQKAKDVAEGLSVSGRPSWAWEFLRRNSTYRDIQSTTKAPKPRVFSNMAVIEAPEIGPQAHDWGIAYAESADLPYLATPVFWRADVDPSILTVSADSAGRKLNDGADAIDFRRLKAAIMVLRLENGTEHVRLVSGLNAIVLEVVDGSILNGPVALSYHIDGFESVAVKLLTIDRLVALGRNNRFRKSDFPLDQRRHRWLLAIRALDYIAAGLSHRQIAERLFPGRDDSSWRDPGGRLRARVRRVINLGLDLTKGGYLQLLSGRSSTKLTSSSKGTLKTPTIPPLHH